MYMHNIQISPLHLHVYDATQSFNSEQQCTAETSVHEKLDNAATLVLFMWLCETLTHIYRYDQ